MGNIFWPNRDETGRERRRLHNEQLHDLYWSPNMMKMEDVMGRECGMCRREEKCTQGCDGET
jgi:hypothetical protein